MRPAARGKGRTALLQVSDVAPPNAPTGYVCALPWSPLLGDSVGSRSLGGVMRGRGLVLGCLTAIAAVLLAGCGSATTKSPERHQERLRKAAGIEVFYVECTRDLWEETSRRTRGGDNGRQGRDGVEGAKVSKATGNLSRVTLTGPQLADYMRVLDWRAHPPSGDGMAEAVRMYDEIARALDGIKAPPPADAPPLLVVDNGFLGAASPSPSVSPSPSRT